MPVFERAHAFQVVKSALEALPLNTRLALDAVGSQLNCSAIVDGLMYNWCNLFDSAWFGFQNLAIISFHDSAGAQILNTTIPGNATALLPVVNGPAAACCQQDVCFVRVTCLVNVLGLISIPNYGPTMFRVGFYIKLPQTTVAMTNGNNATTNLTTWHGVGDLSTLT